MKTYRAPKTVANPDCGVPLPKPQKNDWNPLDGVGINTGFATKKPGIKIRGTGAATKGTMARGPMA